MRMPTYYKVSRLPGKFRIYDVRTPVGKNLPVARGWEHNLEEGQKPTALDPTAAHFSSNPGEMLGKVYHYDQAGNQIGEANDITLGNYVVTEREAHIQSTIEIRPSEHDSEKLTVVEACQNTLGLPEDRAKHPYTLSDSASRRIETAIIDLEWIDSISITPNNSVVLAYTPAGSHPQTLTLRGSDMRDSHGQTLSDVEHIYQSQFYTRETERFEPQIDVFNGIHRLIVHKTKTYDIPKPKDLKIPHQGSLKIHPASADLTIAVANEHVPITRAEPIHPSDIEQIDFSLSQVRRGSVQQAISSQVRDGERGNVSADYVRDPYFYGLVIFACFETLEKWGQNFAIERGKSVRAHRGIQSGRTHTMHFKLLFDEFADLLGTNNPYYKKLTNFAEEIWPAGVSEDTQMEMAYWLKGLRMWVVKEMIAIMAAEKVLGRYYKQNAQRYDFSEPLFNLAFLLSKIDIVEARFLGRKTVMMSWAEMSEIAAGRTWYKLAGPITVEHSSIPIYLGTLGHVMFFPVDLVYFIIAWSFRTVASSINYCQHLWSLGYNFATGFWKNPIIERVFLKGYARAAMRQFLDRNQFGTFMSTVSGSGQVVPSGDIALIAGFATTTALTLISTVVLMSLGGLASWLLLPAGLAAIPVGLALLAKGLSSSNSFKKAALATLGTLATLAAATAVVVGAPVLWTSFLSIAIIANFGFGLYSLGLLIGSLVTIYKAIKAQKNPVEQRTLSTEQQAIFDQVSHDFRHNKLNFGYRDLNEMREDLRQILSEINILDRKGNFIQGEFHPYRNVSHEILDIYTAIEMTLCLKAIRDLYNNPDNATARQSLITLLKETREFIVIDTAAKMYRRLGLKL